MPIFSGAGALHGSGFLAVYVAGLIAGNAKIRSAASIKRFQEGMSWLAQIIMFLILGLFATPSQFVGILPAAIALGLFLMFVARPLAVWLCLAPFRFPRAETAFISWVGLRGAVSILLAITPLLGGLIDGAKFNYAFIIVLVSLVMQGWTIGPLARRLGLIVPPRIGPLEKFELELPGSAHHELLTYRVTPGSPVTRGERLPRWARPSLVVRDGRSFKYPEAGRLVAGDRVYIFVSSRYPKLLDKLFASRAAVDPEDEDFFGAFALDPQRPAAELEAAYAPGLTEAQCKLTISEVVRIRLGGQVEYADRVVLGGIERSCASRGGPHRRTGHFLRAAIDAAGAGVPEFRRDGRPRQPHPAVAQGGTRPRFSRSAAAQGGAIAARRHRKFLHCGACAIMSRGNSNPRRFRWPASRLSTRSATSRARRSRVSI